MFREHQNKLKLQRVSGRRPCSLARHHVMFWVRGRNINERWSTADDPATKLFGMWPGASLVEGNGHPCHAQSTMGTVGGATSQGSAGQPPPGRDDSICCYRYSTVITSLTAEISSILTNIMHSLQTHQLNIVQSFCSIPRTAEDSPTLNLSAGNEDEKTGSH